MLIPQARMRSGAALLALNQSDVPNNCAIAMLATALWRTISTNPFSLGNMTINSTLRGRLGRLPILQCGNIVQHLYNAVFLASMARHRDRTQRAL
jgi:hypothetical protein